MRLGRSNRTVYASESLLRDLTPFDLARAARVPVATAHDWLAGQGPVGGALERLRALGSIVDALQALGLERAEDRAEWLRRPNRAFGQQAPLDLISLDESRRVRDYVAALG
jgi:hypothetical protein